jgi:hypothetical protein
MIDRPSPGPREGRAAARVLGIGAAALALPAALAAAPFWATAALTRHLPRVLPLEPSTTLTWQELLRYVPEIGWQSRPDLDAYAYADDLFHLTTDAEGWRGSRSLDAADMVVFGDSYAFGHGVDDADMYTEHVPGLTVKALGSDGYSMVHGVLWMERLQQRFAGKPVIWMIYAGNDLYDNLRPNYGRYRMPYVRYRDGQWAIHTSHVSEEPWPIPDEPRSYPKELARMCTPGPESDRALDAATYLIERAGEVCRAVGSELTILSVPRRSQIDQKLLPELRANSLDPENFDPRRPDTVMGAAAAARGIPFVALSDHLVADDYQSRDIHWRPRGNRKVGHLLNDLLDPTSRSRAEAV